MLRVRCLTVSPSVACSQNSRRALHGAAKSGQLATIQLLFSAGAVIDATDRARQALQSCAASALPRPRVQLLQLRAALPWPECAVEPASPLANQVVSTACFGSVQDGCTALHIASQGNRDEDHTDCLLALLAAGANVNAECTKVSFLARYCSRKAHSRQTSCRRSLQSHNTP